MNSYEEVNKLRGLILQAAWRAKEGHVASAFSILDVLYVLYEKFVTYDPQNPDSPLRDYVVLSKGHGCLALYAILAKAGFFPPSDIQHFCEYGSKFGGHPDRLKVPGVEASTGSLGHGLPIAVGIAKGLKILNKPNHVYCIVGDGELTEGTNWEAAMLAAQHGLDNLTVIVDYNRSNDRAIEPRPFFVEKFSAFGFDAEFCNGHNHDSIKFLLSGPPTSKKPYAAILATVKGKGIQEMENNPAWHHRAPTGEELLRFNIELGLA